MLKTAVEELGATAESIRTNSFLCTLRNASCDVSSRVCIQDALWSASLKSWRQTARLSSTRKSGMGARVGQVCAICRLALLFFATRFRDLRLILWGGLKLKVACGRCRSRQDILIEVWWWLGSRPLKIRRKFPSPSSSQHCIERGVAGQPGESEGRPPAVAGPTPEGAWPGFDAWLPRSGSAASKCVIRWISWSRGPSRPTWTSPPFSRAVPIP